jgi:outer membrane lipoprotein SlyB
MRIRGASIWAGIISGGIAQYQDTRAYNKGYITKNAYAAHTTKNVVGAVGIMAGIEYGAILGSSIMPGVGTVAGTIIGGLVGDRLGSMVGLQMGSILFNNKMEKENHEHRLERDIPRATEQESMLQ